MIINGLYHSHVTAAPAPSLDAELNSQTNFRQYLKTSTSTHMEFCTCDHECTTHPSKSLITVVVDPYIRVEIEENAKLVAVL